MVGGEEAKLPLTAVVRLLDGRLGAALLLPGCLKGFLGCTVLVIKPAGQDLDVRGIVCVIVRIVGDDRVDALSDLAVETVRGPRTERPVEGPISAGSPQERRGQGEPLGRNVELVSLHGL